MKSSLVYGVIVLVSAMATGLSGHRYQQTAPVSGTGTTAQAQKFDVVSVKPCNPREGGGRGGGSAATASTGRLLVNCQNLFSMITTAYLTYAGGHLNPPWTHPILPAADLPDWVLTDHFTIEAMTGAHPSPEVMRGPMLQSVLEDRFKVKVHVDTREMPVFELIVSKGGSKLTPFTPGSCVPQERWNPDKPELQPGQRSCENRMVRDDSSGRPVATFFFEGQSLDDFAQTIRIHMLPVVNKTGLSGLFTFSFVNVLGSDELAEVVKRFGLDTRPGKAMRQFLVLDRFERPTPNVAMASGTRR